MFEIKKSPVLDLMVLVPKKYEDRRGGFIKLFHAAIYEEFGLPSQFREAFYSNSRAGVIRGLHFQRPPSDHGKLVTCLNGSVLDVVVDLRFGSPTYLCAESFRLSSEICNLVYIPPGFAHGFYCDAGDATMLYMTTCEHDPELDDGVLWSSIDFEWPSTNPIISDRDSDFTAIDEFITPFTYEN